MESRRYRARRVSRHTMECGARGFRHGASDDDVHRRHARLDPRAIRSPPVESHPANKPGAAMLGSSIFALFLFIVILIVIIQAIRVVPQQRAWIVERWGKFHAVLEPGLNF